MVTIKLKASTLIESIIAMTVIAVVFSISMMTIGWGLRAGKTAPMVAAGVALKTVIAETKKERRFFDETIQLEDFTIQKTIHLQEENPKLIRVQFQVLSIEQQLLKNQEILVYVP